MDHLDKQMQAWSPRLRDDLQINPADSQKLATIIAAEVTALPIAAKQTVVAASPVLPSERLKELTAFQAWMELASATVGNPGVTRAQVVTQNYICFVYLKDSCFEVLAEVADQGSVLRKCCEYLVRPPVRYFRNAFAHANWQYKPDFSGLDYWAETGSGKNRTLTQFEVTRRDLDFWQALARCVAYSAFLHL